MTYIDPPSKLLYHADRIAAIGAGLHPAPVNVEIDLSNRCNLGCRGCHMAHTHSRGYHAGKAMPPGVTHTGDLMDTTLAYSILGQLSDMGVRSITWTGGGEPLLHPDALEIFNDCKIDQGLYTNGTLIDPLKAAALKSCMEWVYVSLDRHTREGYQEYKQSDQFNRAVDGIRNLVRAEGKAVIGVGFLLDESNFYHAYDMYHFAESLGADYVQFRPLIVPGAPADWVDTFLGFFRAGPLEKCIIDISRFEMYEKWQGHGYPLCYWAQMQAVITPSGSVWTCVNRRGMGGSLLGSLAKEPFSAIWARSQAHPVDDKCRILCRGHIPNLQLSRMLGPKPAHWRFV